MGDGVARPLAFGRIRGGCQPAGARPRRGGARARARSCSCAHLPERPRVRLLVGALVCTGCAQWNGRSQAGVRLGAGHGVDRCLVWDHRARMDFREGHFPRRRRLPLPSLDAMAWGWDWGAEGLSRCCLFAIRECWRNRLNSHACSQPRMLPVGERVTERSSVNFLLAAGARPQARVYVYSPRRPSLHGRLHPGAPYRTAAPQHAPLAAHTACTHVHPACTRHSRSARLHVPHCGFRHAGVQTSWHDVLPALPAGLQVVASRCRVGPVRRRCSRLPRGGHLFFQICIPPPGGEFACSQLPSLPPIS